MLKSEDPVQTQRSGAYFMITTRIGVRDPTRTAKLPSIFTM